MYKTSKEGIHYALNSGFDQNMCIHDVQFLTPEVAVKTLTSEDVKCTLFQEKSFQAFCYWMPMRVGNDNLREVALAGNVFASPSNQGHAEVSWQAVSFDHVTPTPVGIRIDIYFHGNDTRTYLDHIQAHLRHLVQDMESDTGIGIKLHFPLNIAADTWHLVGGKLVTLNKFIKCVPYIISGDWLAVTRA